MAPLPLQAMDLTSLLAVLAELEPALVPSRFEKAQQCDAHTLQLGFRSLEGVTWIELSWLAEAPRLLAIDPPPRIGGGSTLAQQLQHGLGGLALVALEQQGWERVVELAFAPRPGGAICRRLVLELMGRRSNLFLLDQERRVVAAARQVREQQSRLRPIGTGDPYVPPPALAGQPPALEESFEHWHGQLLLLPVSLRQALQGAYQGISPALALQLCGAERTSAEALLASPVESLTPQQWQGLWQRWQAWLRALQRRQFQFQRGVATAYSCWAPDEQAPPGEPPPRKAAAGLPINRALADYYGRELGCRQRRQRLQALRQRLQQALERERQQCQHQQQLLDQVENSEALQEQADALLCLQQPSREQVAQAQGLYRRARKLRRSVAAITPRLEQHRQRIDQLEASLTFLEQQEGDGQHQDERQLQALEDDCQELLQGSRGKGRLHRAAGSRDGGSGAQPPCPLELRSPGGLRLQVGRNHRQNEWISLRQARRGDLWFHAQECPGSHVVLKASEAEAADADLQAASDLAAHFSRARGNGRVAVVMVPTDDLQRIPGAGPGTVRHRGGTVLWAEPERARTLLHPAVSSLGEEPQP